jgi:hypothetical protein
MARQAERGGYSDMRDGRDRRCDDWVLDKAVKGALLIETVEDHYAELIGRTLE